MGALEQQARADQADIRLNRMAPRFRKASGPSAIVIEKPGRRRRISALNRWSLRFEDACRQRLPVTPILPPRVEIPLQADRHRVNLLAMSEAGR
jgi:hypothetical protein